VCAYGGYAAENLKSYDPVAYYVNSIEDLDVDVRSAYIRNDQVMIAELAKQGKNTFDIFICINKIHAFVLCAPAGNNSNSPFLDMIEDDPLSIPEQLLCWTFELCYQNVELKMYKIRKDFNVFKKLQPSTQAFYIGRYEGVSLNAFQFAALGASPHRFNLLLSDCVEFAKEFCVQLLRYTDNWREIEERVKEEIRKATATGLSVEQLSRNVHSSAWLGNFIINGAFASITYPISFLAGIVVFLYFCKRWGR
jgi:hypothetical protein